MFVFIHDFMSSRLVVSVERDEEDVEEEADGRWSDLHKAECHQRSG